VGESVGGDGLVEDPLPDEVPDPLLDELNDGLAVGVSHTHVGELVVAGDSVGGTGGLFVGGVGGGGTANTTSKPSIAENLPFAISCITNEIALSTSQDPPKSNISIFHSKHVTTLSGISLILGYTLMQFVVLSTSASTIQS
jgi:hypothetical protein